ncbi:MAG: hypothetical protein HDR09_07245 [Lachnospiraceae bacterium]|nr:hypothetical protein [Lachnospiraceae bacterium]
MKSKQELYTYCVKKNQRTKAWCINLRQFAIEKMNEWEKTSVRYNNYYPVVVKLNWQVGMELWGILVNECCEQVSYQDVLQISDRICQDIGKYLTNTMRLRGDMDSVAKFRVNHLDEALMYLGPLDDPNYELFSDDGIMMAEGYNAYLYSIGSNW